MSVTALLQTYNQVSELFLAISAALIVSPRPLLPLCKHMLCPLLTACSNISKCYVSCRENFSLQLFSAGSEVR